MRMAERKRPKKSGKYRPPRGIRLPRKKRFRRKLDTESGIKVRSKYEKRCADYLSRSKIKFQYEPLMLLGNRQFRPDFYLPEYNLFLEICGYGHMPYYRDRVAYKQKIYEQLGLRSVFIYYRGTGSLEEKIGAELVKSGVKFRTHQVQGR